MLSSKDEQPLIETANAERSIFGSSVGQKKPQRHSLTGEPDLYCFSGWQLFREARLSTIKRSLFPS